MIQDMRIEYHLVMLTPILVLMVRLHFRGRPDSLVSNIIEISVCEPYQPRHPLAVGTGNRDCERAPDPRVVLNVHVTSAKGGDHSVSLPGQLGMLEHNQCVFQPYSTISYHTMRVS